MKEKRSPGNVSYSSISGRGNNKAIIEVVMNIIFFICGILAVVSVAVISLYMIFSGGPAIFKIGG